MYIFFCILFCLIGIIFFIIGLQKERHTFQQLENLKRNQLQEKLQKLTKQCEESEHNERQLKLRLAALNHEYDIEKEHLNTLQTQSRQVLKTERERLESEISLTRSLKMKQLDQDYEAKKEALERSFTQRQEEINKEIDRHVNELYQFKQMQEAINEATRRQKELIEKEEFYTINVSQIEQEDILVLQSMDVKLHNKEVIPKLIWELFIRRPTQEMIKRVTGGRDVGGIYKITYKRTGEAYIGKTTSFSTRWQNHIKTAIGLDGAARTTLHNRMAKDGIWNYTFEILEEVDKEHLSAREAYYIELYGTKNQLNMKEGSKNGAQ